MDVLLKLALVILLVYCTNTGSHAYISTDYMNVFCGSSITVGDASIFTPALRLKFTQQSYYSRASCQVTIRAGSFQKLMIMFNDLDMYGTRYFCNSDNLQLHDGSSSSYPYVNQVDGKLCGTTTPSQIFLTSQQYLTIVFVAISTRSYYTGFDMVLTPYRDDELVCNVGEYECSNGRCIDDSLKCSSVNYCGDWSNTWSCGITFSVGGYAGIGIGAFVFILVLLIVSFSYRRRYYRTRVAMAGTVNTNYGTDTQYPPPQYPGTQYPPPGQYPDGKNGY